MMNDIERIILNLEQVKLNQYWPGFEKVAYALYDETSAYIFNHPKFDNQQIVEEKEPFHACTLIIYEGYPTAIVDLRLFKNYEDLYSILVHELFHGYQFLKEEKRFPDELMGITYPITVENVELRNQERLSLFHALMEKEPLAKKEYLNTFIALRQQRELQLGAYLEYENLIETIEGPAWYVELHAYYETSQFEFSAVLQKYGEPLINQYQSTVNIRRSCYSSGLFMCLLLDELSPGWKESFFSTEKTIYQYVKELSVFDAPFRTIEVSPETERVVHAIFQNKEAEFTTFNEEAGIQLMIIGNMEATSFDPMNIVMLAGKVLHKNFLKVKIQEREYLFAQPVVAYGEKLREFGKLQLKLGKELLERDSSLFIEGVGDIKGKIEKKRNQLYLYIED
ncbi:hypothetical protein PZE06_18435 [Robertmurraya sp. DFI.2.37]|uniref:hypothetical protein n=1 Tax=Robertmurraya sp. DFI.2.37 TaxID=3031819 RepID=UPI0023DB89F8|nr:hypothetical protein [Robertmurraya sp. DFI.2.37]MDF1510117.1 hypothetical protein [Robertmurraya sp. DFI.2.37]